VPQPGAGPFTAAIRILGVLIRRLWIWLDGCVLEGG